MREELLDAENNNMTVFIMGHISPGDLNCDPRKQLNLKNISKLAKISRMECKISSLS